MKQIKNIIFDLGGVLIDWNPEYMYKKIILLSMLMISNPFLNYIYDRVYALETLLGSASNVLDMEGI